MTTPHVLTEISNIIPGDAEVKQVFKQFIDLTHDLFETAKSVAGTTSFFPLGLADSIILHVARKGYLIVTDDGPLQQFLNDKGLDFINLEHIRMI